MRKLAYISLLVAGSIVVSCYQKKAERNPNWGNVYTPMEEEADTTDVVYYADTFQLVQSHQIARDLQKNLKRKWVIAPIEYDTISVTDTLAIIHQMALSEVYSSFGVVLKNDNLIKTSNSKIEELALLLCEKENIIRPSTFASDSLPDQMKVFIRESMEQKYVAYAEAKKWMENLYLSLQQSKNVRSPKQYEEIIQLQLENGREMLVRLYAYQEFEPLAHFSQQLITILDSSKEKLDYQELLLIVTDIRNSFGSIQ